MARCCKCSRMEKLIRQIMAEAPTPAPEPRSISQLTGTQMQIEGYPVDSFEDRELINFAITICESPNISYFDRNFTILKAGTYLMNWQVATIGTDQLAHMNFSITLNGVICATASMKLPEVHHEEYICGSVVLNASPGDVIALMNTTDDYVAFKQANITIMGLA